MTEYFAGILGGATVLLVYLVVSTWWLDHKKTAGMWDYLNKQAQQPPGLSRVVEKQ